MKVLYNWLKEFVPLEISPQETAEVLARLGFEIAGLQDFGGSLTGVVAAEVKEVGKHPNADRLSLCKVSDGSQDYSVVCGAANVRAGIRVPFARVGASLRGGETLKAAKIRGVESHGMICSAAELGLEEKSDGILILDDSAALGVDIRSVLGLDDALIEIEVTPNRRDALSVAGVARELSAALALPLKMPEPRVRELDVSNSVTVFNEAPDLCSRYIARPIRDIHVGTAPDWVRQRLQRCGIRSINNIVDITNYVMLELGQPLHAFDAAKMKGRQLRVRRARAGETLLLLDGRTVELRESMLVIADETRPAALAGIMGGKDSAIEDGTKEIILESAAFLPTTIRQTGKALSAASESSYRFERGTDWNMVAFASRRAAQLIQELAGGLGFKPIEPPAPAPVFPTIKLRTDRIRQFLGVEIKESVAADLLRRLGCVINTGAAQLIVTVPSWRLDITMEADLMEELARLYGYDQIPARSPAIRQTTVPEDSHWTFERRLAAGLCGLGLFETSNYSLLSAKQLASFVPGFGQSRDAQPVALANPLSLEQAVLRTSMLPGLLQCALTNFHRQVPGVRLFEFGRIFYRDHEGLHERKRLGILLAGEIEAPHWRRKRRKADFFDISGLVEALAEGLGITGIELLPARESAFHPKRSSVIFCKKRALGWIGEIHPELAESLDTSEPLVAAELEVSHWLEVLPSSTTYSPLSPFPPVHRDLSVVAPLATLYEKIARTVRASGGPGLESVRLIDLYQGDKIAKDQRSLTMSLVFRLKDKTLADADVEKLMGKIVDDLKSKCDAVLRQ